MTNLYVEVPGRPGMRVECRRIEGERVFLAFRGSRADILSLEIVTGETLDPWKPGKPKGKCDAHGVKLWIERYWTVSQGQPTQRFLVLFRGKLISDAERLPGAAAAIEAFRAMEREHAEAARRHQIDRAMAAARAEIISDKLDQARGGRLSDDGHTLH